MATSEMMGSNPICRVCDSQNTKPDVVVDTRQRYKCCDCRTLFFNDLDDDKSNITRSFDLAPVTPITVVKTLPIKEIPQPRQPKIRGPKMGAKRGLYAIGKYLDKHRDEILADRLANGQAAMLLNWRIPYSTWHHTSTRWRKEGVKVPDLRGVNKKTETIREEAKTLTKEIIMEKDVLVTVGRRITLGQLEEILKELEWLRGYKQAVLDCRDKSI